MSSEALATGRGVFLLKVAPLDPIIKTGPLDILYIGFSLDPPVAVLLPDLVDYVYELLYFDPFFSLDLDRDLLFLLLE